MSHSADHKAQIMRVSNCEIESCTVFLFKNWSNLEKVNIGWPDN